MFYLGWPLNFKYLETKAYLSKVLAFIFMCPWTVMSKSQTIQRQIITVVWSDLDIHNGSNSIMYLCELKFYTVSNPVHGFAESAGFVGFTGGLRQFCYWNIFMRVKTPVFSVSAQVTVQNTCFLPRVSMCCQNITCLKTGAFPVGVGLWGQPWLEPCVSHVSSGSWVLARRCLCRAEQRGSWPGDVALGEIWGMWKAVADGS